MSGNARKLSLTSYDDIFSTEESRANEHRESVQQIPLSELHPFKNHPFQVRDDERMQETAESIKEYGVLVPAIARPKEGGGYELVAGHRRKRACELAGLETMPVIVRDLDDDAAILVMVDSNLQRENILPSERAYAYKMKLEAIKRRAGRPSNENRDQVGHNLAGKRSIDLIADNAPDSRNQIQRYIRLTNLVPELLEKVDNKALAFNPAVELSYLPPETQRHMMSAMEVTQSAPSLSQAQRIKKFSQMGRASEDVLLAIMSEEKKPETGKVTISTDRLRKYFPKSYTPQKMEEVIFKLLDAWQRRREKDMER